MDDARAIILQEIEQVDHEINNLHVRKHALQTVLRKLEQSGVRQSLKGVVTAAVEIYQERLEEIPPAKPEPEPRADDNRSTMGKAVDALMEHGVLHYKELARMCQVTSSAMATCICVHPSVFERVDRGCYRLYAEAKAYVA